MKKISILLFASIYIFAESTSLEKIEIEATNNNDPSYLIEKEGYLKLAPLQKQITIKDSLEIAGTNGDPIKALKSFAGVVSTNNDNGSDIFIHGSKPRESMFSINHLPIGYVFHLGGFHSVISPEATSQIDAYLGGFDVSYDSMGAVVDITPKYPTGSGEGRVHLGMYDADFAYDAKLSENTNLFIGARRSYFDFIAKDIMEELEKDNDDSSKKTTFRLFPQFYDAQMILSHDFKNHIFSLEMITSQDEMKLDTTMNKSKDPVANGKINSKVGFTTVGARWSYIGDNFTSMTLLSYIHTKEDLELFDADFFVNTSNHEYKLYHESVFEFKNHKPMVGFEALKVDAPIKAYITNPPSMDDFEPLVTDQEVVTLKKTFHANKYTVFVQDIWDISQRDHFRYGLRAWKTDFQEFGGGVDPRVAYVHEFDDTLSASVSIGKYSQLPEIAYVIDGFGNPKIDTNEFSNHYTLNITKEFSDNSSVSIEPYFKTFEDLAINDEELKYQSVGEGEAYGVDITYKKSIENFNMIFAYTFIKAKRELNTKNNKQYTFVGDIPNTLQLNLNYQFENSWRISSLFKYNDGRVYTPIISTEDYLYNGKNYKRPIYGEPYSKRMPYNLDWDIQIGRTLKYADNKSLEFSLEFMNITSLFRENISEYKYNDLYERDGEYNQMGFLPAIHVNYRF